MNLIQKLKAPTPYKYKYWGSKLKWMSGALIAGALAVNSIGTALPQSANIVIASMIFITTTASTACYAQVDPNPEPNTVEDDTKVK